MSFTAFCIENNVVETFGGHLRIYPLVHGENYILLTRNVVFTIPR